MRIRTPSEQNKQGERSMIKQIKIVNIVEELKNLIPFKNIDYDENKIICNFTFDVKIRR